MNILPALGLFGNTLRLLAKSAGCAALLLANVSPASAADARATATFTNFRYEGVQPGQAKLKVGKDEFRNPIIAGSRSDPTITRAGRDYYLSNTSFGDWPGAPIWRSRDLINWKLLGHAFTHTDKPDLSRNDPAWQGVWTNDLKYNDGWFYLSGVCYACGGIFVMRTRDPVNWPKPTFLPIEGIDASFFFDDDGRIYITHNGLPPEGVTYDGHRAIWLQEIDVTTMTLKGDHTLLVNGGTHPPEKPFWIEGEHLFKKDGRFYLIAAQGGTNENHSEVVFRSDALRGPYFQGPVNPILTQLGLDPNRPNPVANAGHADFVQTPAGDWWAVFLGARPNTANPLDFATGRDTYLLPVTWREGWPIILTAGEAVPIIAKRPKLPNAPVADWPTAGDYTVTDSFKGNALSLHWSMLRTSAERWHRTGSGGLALTLRPVELGAAEGQPSFVGYRQAHINATASITVRFSPTRPNERAGLAAVQDERRWLSIVVAGTPNAGREVRLVARNGDGDPKQGVTRASAPLAAGSAPVQLRITVDGPSCRFAYATQKMRWQPLGPDQDCSILSNRIARGFTGVMLGPVAIAAP